MPKVLYISGSPNENGCTDAAMNEVIRVLQDGGVNTKKFCLEKPPKYPLAVKGD